MLRQLLLVTSWNSSRKWGVLLSMVLYSIVVFCATHKVGMKSVWLSLGIQYYEQTFSSSSMMTLVAGILVCIAWLVPYPNDFGRKDCMLILNNTANSTWFARGEGYKCSIVGTIVACSNTFVPI